jgi:hypothetical protein
MADTPHGVMMRGRALYCDADYLSDWGGAATLSPLLQPVLR